MKCTVVYEKLLVKINGNHILGQYGRIELHMNGFFSDIL